MLQWNAKANGRSGVGGAGLWDYEADRLVGNYWHTFFRDLGSLAAVGVPRALTFRSFEYQAVAIARLWAGRSVRGLPGPEEQARWEAGREQATRRDGRRFHDIPWEDGETHHWLGGLFEIAGLGTLTGDGRIPPVLSKELIWAIEHIRKYPDPNKGEDGGKEGAIAAAATNDRGSSQAATTEEKKQEMEQEAEWIVVDRPHRKDLLSFI